MTPSLTKECACSTAATTTTSITAMTAAPVHAHATAPATTAAPAAALVTAATAAATVPATLRRRAPLYAFLDPATLVALIRLCLRRFLRAAAASCCCCTSQPLEGRGLQHKWLFLLAHFLREQMSRCTKPNQGKEFQTRNPTPTVPTLLQIRNPRPTYPAADEKPKTYLPPLSCCPPLLQNRKINSIKNSRWEVTCLRLLIR